MKITTMTLSAVFNKRIDPIKLFPLLEIDGKYGKMVKNDNKYNFDSEIRSFNNCISTKFLYNKKLYNVKIFCTQIQICGINDPNIIVDLTNSILKRLLILRFILKDLRHYPNIKPVTEDYLQVFLSGLEHKEVQKNWILSLSHKIVPKDLKITVINENMVNHFFELGYNVNLISLSLLFHNQYENINVTYENTVHDVVIIRIYMDENSVSTLMIRESGKITQSGNSIHYNEAARDIFFNIIEDNKKDIEWVY